MSELEVNLKIMNVLASNIINVSKKLKDSRSEDLIYPTVVHRRHINNKNAFVSELMKTIAECRKMDLSKIDKAKLDSTINTLNKKLYAATSLTIL